MCSEITIDEKTAGRIHRMRMMVAGKKDGT
jgi:hypothetical protein